MSAPTQLVARLERLNGYARRAEWDDVTLWLGGHLKELRKTERERSWPLGRCIWCEIDGRRLVEAVVYDPGGGPPMCERHSNAFDSDLAAAGQQGVADHGC